MIKHVAIVLALAASSPAAADSRHVRYADLDLSNAAGTAKLDRRINAAARSVCGGRSSRLVDRGFAADSRQCVNAAKAKAYRQLRSKNVVFATR